jgi:hypothetical protein
MTFRSLWLAKWDVLEAFSISFHMRMKINYSNVSFDEKCMVEVGIAETSVLEKRSE